MKEIRLTRGQTTVVDDCDFERVSAYRWYATRCMDRFYAARSARKNEPGTTVLMHRFILDAPPTHDVDHIDNNPLNNTRANIRLVTTAQNMVNRKMHRNNTTGYRGVIQVGDRWVAKIKHSNETIHIGSFATAIEAAKAFDEVALRLRGSFAHLNFPSDHNNESSLSREAAD